jgi:thiol-disulfide isomerase/thioredoxin
MKYLRLLLFPLLLGCSEAPEGGSTSAIEQLRGQWVIINYWAKWCSPCIKEIPELNAIHRNYDQVSVLGVNYDGATGEELASQLSALQVGFPTLEEDPAARLGTPRPLVLPTTLIINPGGQITQTLVGPQTLASLLRATEQIPFDDNSKEREAGL